MNYLTFTKKTHYIEDESLSYLWLWDAAIKTPQNCTIHHTFEPNTTISISSTDLDSLSMTFTSDCLRNTYLELVLCAQELSAEFFDNKELFKFFLHNDIPANLPEYDSFRESVLGNNKPID